MKQRYQCASLRRDYRVSAMWGVAPQGGDIGGVHTGFHLEHATHGRSPGAAAFVKLCLNSKLRLDRGCLWSKPFWAELWIIGDWDNVTVEFGAATGNQRKGLALRKRTRMVTPSERPRDRRKRKRIAQYHGH